MKAYIIAAALFVTGLLILGAATSNLMEPDKPKQQPHTAPQPKTGGGYASQEGPATPSYPAATPGQRNSMQGTTQGMNSRMQGLNSAMPGLNSTMPGMPSTGMPPEPGGISGISGPIGISAPPAIPVPRAEPIEPTTPVPIIQPDDLGSDTSPTRGRTHQ